MAEYQIALLPMLALALIILFPLFEKDLTLSRSRRSRRLRRITLGRIAVVSLLVATLITYFWPHEATSDLLQAAFITVLFLLPFLIRHWVLSLRYSSSRYSDANAIDVEGNSLEGDVDVVSAAKTQLLSAIASKPEQQVTSTKRTDVSSPLVKRPSETPLEAASPDISQLQERAESQQAYLDSKQEEYTQARIISRDAITMMKVARAKQKRAEQLAKRERLERKRLELQLEKMSNALLSATSTLNKQKAADDKRQKSEKSETV